MMIAVGPMPMPVATGGMSYYLDIYLRVEQLWLLDLIIRDLIDFAQIRGRSGTAVLRDLDGVHAG